ncbi:hypothetical protein GN956_G26589 [Arapaima gigas]
MRVFGSAVGVRDLLLPPCCLLGGRPPGVRLCPPQARSSDAPELFSPLDELVFEKESPVKVFTAMHRGNHSLLCKQDPSSNPSIPPPKATAPRGAPLSSLWGSSSLRELSGDNAGGSLDRGGEPPESLC